MRGLLNREGSLNQGSLNHKSTVIVSDRISKLFKLSAHLVQSHLTGSYSANLASVDIKYCIIYIKYGCTLLDLSINLEFGAKRELC